jgi:hypothetical protein
MTMRSLPTPSACQQAVIDQFLQRKSVIVTAVAGAGKSSTLLMLCRAAPRLRFLLLTYNSQLRRETKLAARKYGLGDVVELHTFHSMCRKYYVSSGYTDKIIRTAVEDDLPPKKALNYDVFLLDEQQDCNSLYFSFVRKIVRDNDARCQLVVVGDPRQNIYGYQGADSRFLTLATHREVYGACSSASSWGRCRLVESRRVPQEHAMFVDRCMLRGQGEITSSKPGERPIYCVCNVFERDPVKNAPLQQVMTWLTESKYAYNDVMVLAPSIRRSTPAKQLQEMLSARKVPCYVPCGDDVEPCEAAMRGKVVFSTFHQAKGRERSYVVVFGFDASYFEFYDKNAPVDECPNALYVACTRARKSMMLLQSDRKGRLPFLRSELLEHYVTMVDDQTQTATATVQDNGNGNRTPIAVTNLIRHLPEEMVERWVDAIPFVQVSPPCMDPIDVPNEHQSTVRGSVEEVSDYNGSIACMLAEQNVHDARSSILSQLRTADGAILRGKPFAGMAVIRERVRAVWSRYMDTSEMSLEDTVFLSCVCVDVRNGYTCRTLQLPDFAWWTQEAAARVVEVLEEHGVTPSDAEKVSFEETLSAPAPDDCAHLPEIAGRVDVLIRDDALLEVKFTSQTRPEHKLQLLVYMWLYGRVHGRTAAESMRFVLVNVKTGEAFQARYEEDVLNDMVIALLRKRFDLDAPRRITDEQFLASCMACDKRN